ncbi:CBS domain-containing protein [Planomonospora corallina]|uniref:CBS domain-containing protein n=1 Tax=Planomonospora corallina TaxID=1806052 RepID=A0ABV8I5P6_9ACTN
MHVKVEDVMTAQVTSVNGCTPFKDVAEVMINHEVSAVPVVDGEGHVIGVVSEADLLRKEEFKEQYYQEGYQPPLRVRLRRRLGGREDARRKATGDTAAELMTSPAVTIRSAASIVSAIRLMEEHGVKRLPVVDAEGRLEGIVSRQDLLKVFVRDDAEIAREVNQDILGRPLWEGPHDATATVERGIVTLSGRMRLRRDARLVVRLVQRVHGVVDVVDRLEWETGGTDRKAP